MPELVVGVMLLMFIIMKNKRPIYGFLLYLSFSIEITSLYKTFSASPRPYWVSNYDIQALDWKCYKEYGNPSGHSISAVIIAEFIFTSFILRPII